MDRRRVHVTWERRNTRKTDIARNDMEIASKARIAERLCGVAIKLAAAEAGQRRRVCDDDESFFLFGVESPTHLLQWVMNLETHFEEQKIQDPRRVTVASRRLRGAAEISWRVQQKCKPINKWKNMIVMLIEKMVQSSKHVDWWRKLETWRFQKEDIALKGKNYQGDALRSMKDEYECLIEEVRPWYQDVKENRKRARITPSVTQMKKVKILRSRQILSLIEETFKCEEIGFHKPNGPKVEDLRKPEDGIFGYQKCKVELESNCTGNRSTGDPSIEVIVIAEMMVEAEYNRGGAKPRRGFCVNTVVEAMELCAVEKVHVEVMSVKDNVDKIAMEIVEMVSANCNNVEDLKGEGEMECSPMFDFPIDGKEIVEGIDHWGDILDKEDDLWNKIRTVDLPVEKEEMTIEKMELLHAVVMADIEQDTRHILGFMSHVDNNEDIYKVARVDCMVKNLSNEDRNQKTHWKRRRKFKF